MKRQEVFEAPAKVERGNGVVKICTAIWITITVSEDLRWWEVEEGPIRDCGGETVLVKVRRAENETAIKYADGRVYAARIGKYWSEAAVADSERGLPEWARF